MFSLIAGLPYFNHISFAQLALRNTVYITQDTLIM